MATLFERSLSIPMARTSSVAAVTIKRRSTTVRECARRPLSGVICTCLTWQTPKVMWPALMMDSGTQRKTIFSLRAHKTAQFASGTCTRKKSESKRNLLIRLLWKLKALVDAKYQSLRHSIRTRVRWFTVAAATAAYRFGTYEQTTYTDRSFTLLRPTSLTVRSQLFKCLETAIGSLVDRRMIRWKCGTFESWINLSSPGKTW